MAARKKCTAALSHSRSCRYALKKCTVLVAACCFCVYAFVWRHYLALLFIQPAAKSYSYHKNYQEMHVNVDPKQVAESRKELTESLPKWIADYVEWHAQARHSMLQDDAGAINAPPILLVSIEIPHSGGLADRLRSIPFLLWEAVRMKRLFLMQWKQPCALEEFLLPPLGGIDWTVPESVQTDSRDAVWYSYDNQDSNIRLLAENDAYTEHAFVKTRHSPSTFEQGMPLLAKALNVTSLTDPIFSRIYKLLLVPSPPVQALLEKTMTLLQLVPRQYYGIHLRARYPGSNAAFSSKRWAFARSVDADGFKWTRDAQQQVELVASRAIQCLENHTAPTTMPPIYFASDTNEAVKFVASSSSPNVVGMVTRTEKLHLDRNKNMPPSAFLPAIVDLLILSQAACLVVGAGGFGVFAAILGGIDCLLLHSENTFVGDNIQTCGNEEKK